MSSTSIQSSVLKQKKLFYDFVLKQSGHPSRNLKVALSPHCLLSEALIAVYNKDKFKRHHAAGIALPISSADISSGVTQEEEIRMFLDRISSLSVKGSDLLDFIFDDDASLLDLDSSSTPLQTYPIIVQLSASAENADSDDPKNFITPSKHPKTNLVNPFTTMMAANTEQIRFLDFVVNDNGTPQEELPLDKQIEQQILAYTKELNVGYPLPHLEAQLKKNVLYLVKTLCFFHEHWFKFYKKERPYFPSSACELIQRFSKLERVGNKRKKK
jgi:hypothetical protein